MPCLGLDRLNALDLTLDAPLVRFVSVDALEPWVLEQSIIVGCVAVISQLISVMFRVFSIGRALVGPPLHILSLAVNDDLLVDGLAHECDLHPAHELEPLGVELLHVADRRLHELVWLVVLLHEGLDYVEELAVLVDVLKVHLGRFVEGLRRVAEHEEAAVEKLLR